MKIQINARNRAHHFDAEPDENILYAGLGEAVALAYECASGTCGTCKARLVSGEIEDAWPEAPGRKFAKGAGEFLMCQCRAKTDIVAETATFVHRMEAGAVVPAEMTGTIASTKALTHDVMQLMVDLDGAMDFDAGQFVMIQVPGVSGYRGWSMVNYELRARTLEFVVKRKPGGGLSEWLFEGNRTGTRVQLFGPLGHATFYPSVAKNILCIAGGSGIAGMMSILSRAADEGYFTTHEGHVFFGVRTMNDAFFLDQFTRLKKQCSGKLNVVIALSEEDVPAWTATEHPDLVFDRGFVHDVADRHMQGRYQNVRAYLAGPPPAVDASIRLLLLKAKLTADNIRYDKFS
jgi:toluene monooxygenase electron transfer component